MNNHTRPKAPGRRGPRAWNRTRTWTIGLILAASPLATARALGQDGPGRVEALVKPDGGRVEGSLAFDPAKGFSLRTGDGVEAIGRGATLAVEAPWPNSARAAGLPPFHIVLGQEQQVSGRLTRMDDKAVRIEDGPSGATLNIDRAGIQTVSQRPGEAVDVQDGFETLELAKWSIVGAPEVSADPKLSGGHSLQLPAGGSAVTRKLASPVTSGRIELAFLDDTNVAEGHQYFVDLLFRGTSGAESVRAVLGWADDSLAVQSPGGPALVVQRLARRKGWRRLDIRFGPGRTEVAVDGDDLAHGKGATGPLVEIRLGTERLPKAPPAAKGLAAHFDDLRIVRQAGTSTSPEIDPGQDEVRLVEGDQIFGALEPADADRLSLKVDGKSVGFAWREVSAVRLARKPSPSPLLEGHWARVAWRAAPGDDIHDLDRAEGVVKGLTAGSLTLATPYAGTFAVPRDQIRRVDLLGRMTRGVLDPTPHHLGDEIARESNPIDPPQPEGSTLEMTFRLDRVPEGPAFLSMDVLQVVGGDRSLPFADDIAKGELRTNVAINGKPVDYLNRHIRDRNEIPERIRLPIPAGVLKAGANDLKITQAIRVEDNYVDDLGVLGIALEFDPPEGPKPGAR